MDETTQAHIADLLSDDRERTSAGFMSVMAATEQPVDWAYDILESMRNVYNVVKDDSIKAKALALIETEEDAKYRKKYAVLWNKASC